MSKREGLVAHLKKLDNAALAELRRSLSFKPGEYPRAFPFVERFAAGSSRRRAAHYLLAGLYALKERAPEKGEREQMDADATDPKSITLGGSVGRLRDREGKRAKSTEQRFLRLLDADHEELPNPLRQMISLLKAGGQEIDWETLLNDLINWNSADRRVQVRWAQHFYRESLDDQSETSGG